jgi:tetratricopeptide (TPR) repeat protein
MRRASRVTFVVLWASATLTTQLTCVDTARSCGAGLQPCRNAGLAGLKACPTVAMLVSSQRDAGGASRSSQNNPNKARVSRSAAAPPETIARIAGFLERGDLPAAKRDLDSALREYSRDPALHNFAGVIAAQEGAYERAERSFQEAIRLAPRVASPYLNLGRLHQERAGTDAAAGDNAINVYRQLLAIDPANSEALYQAGFLLALRGTFGESRALVQRLPDQARGRPQVLALLAADLAGLGDTAGANSLVEKLAAHAELSEADVLGVLPAFEHTRDDTIAMRLLEALDRRGLASPDSLRRLGAIHLHHDRAKEARGVLERAAARGATPPILLDLARAAYKQRDLKGALGYLAHARDLDPKNAVVHFFFGMVCVDLNLGREAYDSLKQAFALDPQNPYVNYALGAVALHRHDPSEALPYFEAFVRLRPADPRGRFALGAARFYSNQFEGARAALAQAARHPETAAGAHYFLGRIARQLNDLPAARRALDQALTLRPEYADAWAELGLVQIRESQYADAEQSLAQALAIEPENYAATLNLATLYSRTKDPRRESQAARLAALQEQRAIRAQEFLRIVEVVP